MAEAPIILPFLSENFSPISKIRPIPLSTKMISTFSGNWLKRSISLNLKKIVIISKTWNNFSEKRAQKLAIDAITSIESCFTNSSVRSRLTSFLNHLISMEKYSGRLCHPNLVGRVEFQWKGYERMI